MNVCVRIKEHIKLSPNPLKPSLHFPSNSSPVSVCIIQGLKNKGLR